MKKKGFSPRISESEILSNRKIFYDSPIRNHYVPSYTI